MALVAFVPFVRGVLAGGALYFRDLSLIFHPFRRFVAEGLRQGEARYWDPFVHEGVPLVYPPIAYPLDLLHAVWIDERWFSLLLALHVPFAAVAVFALARSFGLSPVAAGGAGLVYALGGFALSTLNFYLYVQALAWAPVTILTLRRATHGTGRHVVWAGASIAVLISTLGMELALQAVVIAFVLLVPARHPGAWTRAAGSVVLGTALAAPVILVMKAQMATGERVGGFPVDVMLNQSVHPLGLLQVLIADLFGDLGALPDRWWGSRFFDRGFPYILSVYLGATVLALALAGGWSRQGPTRRLAVLLVLALAATLGRYAGLSSVLDLVPPALRVFRFPVKLFFTVHLATALLAGWGLEALVRDPVAWKRLAVAAGLLGLALAAVPALPWLVPGGAAWFVAHFFPAALSWPTRLGHLEHLARDAGTGGALALVLAALAVLVRRGRLAPRTGALLAATLAVADLLRAGAGLNPMVGASFFAVSPEVQAVLRTVPDLQRVFTCNVEGSAAYWRARRERGAHHELMTFAAQTDTLTPHRNRAVHIRSALSPDLTSLVPRSRLPPPGLSCADPDTLVPELRRRGVSHVVSLDPLTHAGLHEVARAAPARIAPLALHLYAVTEPRPLRFVATRIRRAKPPDDSTVWIADAPADVDGATGTVRVVRETMRILEMDVDASQETAVVVLEGSFPGWKAWRNGEPAPMLEASHHRAVWVPAGHSRVVMRYSPRGLREGLVIALLAMGAAGVLWRGGLRGAAPPQAEGAAPPS